VFEWTVEHWDMGHVLIVKQFTWIFIVTSTMIMLSFPCIPNVGQLMMLWTYFKIF